MTWIDYGILALIGLSAVVGLMRGLIREVISLTVLGAAIWAGLAYSHEVSNRLLPIITMPAPRMAAAFLMVFAFGLLAGGIAGRWLGKLARAGGMSGTDRFAGLLFGIARGGVIAAVLVFLGELAAMPKAPWWHESKLIPQIQALTVWLKSQIPADLASQVKLP